MFTIRLVGIFCYREQNSTKRLLLSQASLEMADYNYTRPKDQTTGNGDVLGDKGREALRACVKVTIYGRPETRRYYYEEARERVKNCYASPERLNSVVGEEFPGPSRDKDRNCLLEKTFNVVDIYNALDKFDNISYVEKYPKGEPGSEKTKLLIDKRRADIEKELKEATCNPDKRHRYSLSVAQRRVRDCYAGNFLSDGKIELPSVNRDKYNIEDIREAVDQHDKYSLETCSYEERDVYMEISSHRADLQKKYEEAVASTGTLHKYEQKWVAVECLKACYHNKHFYVSHDPVFPCEICKYPECPSLKVYCIFKLHDALRRHDKDLRRLHKYPDHGPGSDKLKNLIDEHRADLSKEYEKFLKSDRSKLSAREYSRSEAERSVRDCFAGSFNGDVDIFPTKKDESGMPSIFQTFDIFDIKQSLDYFDTQKPFEKYPESGHITDNRKKEVEAMRADIEQDYKVATTKCDIEHGSGFIICDHFILTNKHVIQTYLDKEDSYEIHISNASIGELSCKIAHCDPEKDLALLYCQDLNSQQRNICPLQLSIQPLLPGMQIFSFGYPLSHTGKTALLVTGNVSGSKETLSGHLMAVLNCSLNSGNSGGPVVSWINNQLKVVGMATQKHFKEILTPEERIVIERIRESMQTCTIQVSDQEVEHFIFSKRLSCLSGSYQTPIQLLTLKLYDALETHSQFNLSNALPAKFVVEFIKNFTTEYTGEFKEELEILCQEYDVCN